jgi:hypothetical protein
MLSVIPFEVAVETKLWRTLVHLGLGLGLLALSLL